MLDNSFSACIVPYILFPLCIYLLFIPYFDFYDLILFVSISFKLAIFSLSLFIFFLFLAQCIIEGFPIIRTKLK